MYRFAIATLFAAAFSTTASAATIDFESIEDCTTDMVTITAGPAFAECTFTRTPNGTQGIRKGGKYASFWYATFSEAMKYVSIDLGDFGDLYKDERRIDDDELFLAAFTKDNVLIETLKIESIQSGMFTLAIEAYNIHSIAFGATERIGHGGVHADNLVYDVQAVPVPASVLLLGSAFAGLGFVRARKKA